MKVYKATARDRLVMVQKPDMLKVSGDQVFATLQGEGITSGKPAVFLRLHFCNLACSWCDTKYTWDKNREEFWHELEDWGYEKTAARIVDAWNEKFGNKDELEKRVVITGGEPLLQQQKIAKLLTYLPDWKVEIETNGTIPPISELRSCQFNCSPKLANSGNSLLLRYRPQALKHINSLPNSWFKFVVSKVSDFIEIDQIASECGLKLEKILVMPEGYLLESIEAHKKLIQEEVQRRGWKLTMRNQIVWFGNKRRT